MKLGEFFMPARLSPAIAISDAERLDMGYVGECCRLCGLIVHEGQRQEHVAQHVAAGALIEAVGTGEPEWFIRDYGSGSPWIPAIHDRHCQRAPALAVGERTVHLLHHGRTLCGFTEKAPGEWGEGHWWVGLEERENATCAPCVEGVAALCREGGL
jgi:hypothetical protein